MDEQFGTAMLVVEQASTEYLGYWHRLVSTTNWEKGRIICRWRQALVEGGAPPSAWTDDAWSRLAGNVSPQHVGRLRRVYERFGQCADQYAGLYWSHFQAALDWPDAEMWLEGAVQGGWSVAQMRQQRWEALGAPPDKKPRQEDIFSAELDEDFSPANDGKLPEMISGALGEVRDPEARDARRDDDRRAAASGRSAEGEFSHAHALDQEASGAAAVRALENLPDLPPDLAEAWELLKLAILRHKMSAWREVSCGDVLAALEALKRLALAPAGV